MSSDRNQILRGSKLTRRGNPLDQAQCNFVLLCLAQQFIPFLASGKPSGPLAKSSDLIAQAIDMERFVQNRILPVWQLFVGYGQLTGRFRTVERLSNPRPGRLSAGARREIARDLERQTDHAEGSPKNAGAERRETCDGCGSGQSGKPG